jgi:hypothetical protein
LIPNPSAECYTCDAECKAELLNTGSKLAGYYNTDEWFMPTDGSADYMNSCALGTGANTPRSHVGLGRKRISWFI